MFYFLVRSLTGDVVSQVSKPATVLEALLLGAFHSWHALLQQSQTSAQTKSGLPGQDSSVFSFATASVSLWGSAALAAEEVQTVQADTPIQTDDPDK